jgi:hypothetical protein
MLDEDLIEWILKDCGIKMHLENAGRRIYWMKI